MSGLERKWLSLTELKAANRALFPKHQMGHIELGYTLALWVIIACVAAMHYFSDGEPIRLWHSWPWWLQVISLIMPFVIFYLGGAFEDARRWPKHFLDDEENSESGDVTNSLDDTKDISKSKRSEDSRESASMRRNDKH